MGRLEGKSVLVTAAGQGIGRASAVAMAKEGAKVFATDINMESLKTLDDYSHPNIVTFKLDVLDDGSVANGVSKSSPDIIFNCAGFVHNGTVLEATTKDWDYAFDLNVKSMLIQKNGSVRFREILESKKNATFLVIFFV